MKRKWFLGSLGVVGVIILSVFGWTVLAASQDRDQLNHELDLARKEGLPTNWQEFAALVPKAPNGENAAPLYRRMRGYPKDSADIPQLNVGVLIRKDKAEVEAAKAELQYQRDVVANADLAARFPHCWFDRDWSKGMAVLMPELAYMKFAAKLVALRGSIAAFEGHPDEAIHNIDEVFKIAKHSGEEGTQISTLVQMAIETIGIHYLGLWALEYPDVPGYRTRLQSAVATSLTPNIQWMHRTDLIDIRDVLALSTTAKGRADLGLKDEDVPTAEKIIPFFVSRPKADIKIARLMRKIWEAYGDPPATRISKIDGYWGELMPSLIAYPTGADIYTKFTDMGDSNHGQYLFDQVSESKRLMYRALIRAYGEKTIPSKIRTDDLKSPFDGRPLSYRFDGKQITIEVSCPDKDLDLKPLKMPSDSELTPPKKRAK